MCGIAGYFGPLIPADIRLKSAEESLGHRGPDGSGIFSATVDSQNGVALIHTRLAIIDIGSQSNQPFHHADGVLVFNGEIYNFKKIREELKSRGCTFSTNGDVEVLAQALTYWGEKAVNRLEGMWSFAWYKKSTNTLLLSRDRFGEKPLYIWKTNSGFYFASEIKALAALHGSWPEINIDHLMRYMVNGYKSLYKTSENFYKGVEELQSGANLILNEKGCCKNKYWTPKLKSISDGSYEELVEQVRHKLIDSVAGSLISDVPMAFCMSGGIDSNSIIAIAKKILGFDVHGFTIQNSDERYEESNLVSKSVKSLGIKHTSVSLSKDNFLDNLKNLIEKRSGPIATISYYVQWMLMRDISQYGYKVTVSGTGADELFTGYHDHHNLYLAGVYEDKHLYNKSLSAWNRYQANIVRNPFLKDPKIFINTPEFRNHIFLDADYFSSFLKRDWNEVFSEENFGVGLLRNRMLNELFHEVVPPILHEDDLNAMNFSMENRSPFLNSQLFEMAYSIPEKYLMRDGMTKMPLRDAMRGIVPDEVLNNRKKIGFNAPIMDLLNVSNKTVLDEILSDDLIYDYVDRDKINALLNKGFLKNSESKFLFSFLNSKFFMQASKHRI